MIGGRGFIFLNTSFVLGAHVGIIEKEDKYRTLVNIIDSGSWALILRALHNVLRLISIVTPPL